MCSSKLSEFPFYRRKNKKKLFFQKIFFSVEKSKNNKTVHFLTLKYLLGYFLSRMNMNRLFIYVYRYIRPRRGYVRVSWWIYHTIFMQNSRQKFIILNSACSRWFLVYLFRVKKKCLAKEMTTCYKWERKREKIVRTNLFSIIVLCYVCI